WVRSFPAPRLIILGQYQAVGLGLEQAPGQLRHGFADELHVGVREAGVDAADVQTAGHAGGHDGALVIDAAHAVLRANAHVPKLVAVLDLVAIAARVAQGVVWRGVIGPASGVDDAGTGKAQGPGAARVEREDTGPHLAEHERVG